MTAVGQATATLPTHATNAPKRAIVAGPGEPGLVSVVIPTYNRAYIVGRTIESVLAQTYSPVEILVIDDGSTDDTPAVVGRFGDRVRYIRQPNGGVAVARNHGFAEARGEFVALLDSDDEWLPWKLEAQVAFLRRHPELGMCWTDMIAVDDDGRLVSPKFLRTFYGAYSQVDVDRALTRGPAVGELSPRLPAEVASAPTWYGDLFPHLLLGSLVHTPTVLLRRDRLRQTDGFDPALWPAGEDYDFHLRTCRYGPVGFLDVPSIRYRIGNPDQITAPSRRLAFARMNLKTLTLWMALEPARVTLPPAKIRWRLAHAHGWLGEEEQLNGNASAARTHLLRTLRYQPWQPRRAALLALTFVPDGMRERLTRLWRRLRGTERAAEAA